MIYKLLFMVRYFPFWAVPAALVCFEVGVFSYHRRSRLAMSLWFGGTAILVAASIAWIVFEGYWRGPLVVKRLLQAYFME